MSSRLQFSLAILGVLLCTAVAGVGSWLYTGDWISGVVFGGLALITVAVAFVL